MNNQLFLRLKKLFIDGFISICLVMVYNSAKAQTSIYKSSGFTDVYSNALGMSGVSSSYSNTSMYSNPANLSFLLHPMTLSIDHYYDAYNAVQFDNLSSVIYKSETQAIALGLTTRNSGYGSIEKTIGLFSPADSVSRFQQLDFTLGYSVKILDNLSVGALFQLNNGSIMNRAEMKKNKMTGIVNLGILYSPTGGISYGLALRGIGRDLTYTRQNDINSISTIEQHQSLSLGISMHYPYASLDSQPFINLTVSNEKFFGRNGLWYKAGLEVLPIQEIGLRSGYIYNPSFTGFTLGLGLNYHSFLLNYAISPGQKSLQYQQISISINIQNLLRRNTQN